MSGKLYAVTATLTTYHWSEGGDPPDSFACRSAIAQEVANTDDFDAEVADELLARGWHPEALVYGDHDYEMTLREALAKTREALEPDRALVAALQGQIDALRRDTGVTQVHARCGGGRVFITWRSYGRACRVSCEAHPAALEAALNLATRTNNPNEVTP